jgi:hypothetical protein
VWVIVIPVIVVAAAQIRASIRTGRARRIAPTGLIVPWRSTQSERLARLSSH